MRTLPLLLCSLFLPGCFTDRTEFGQVGYMSFVDPAVAIKKPLHSSGGRVCYKMFDGVKKKMMKRGINHVTKVKLIKERQSNFLSKSTNTCYIIRGS